MPDGRILYTRISHLVDRTDCGPSIWGHILTDQLEVTAEEFWACVEDQTLPARSLMPEPREAIPIGVLRVLLHEARVPEAEVRAMTKAEAVQRLADFYLADFYTHGT